MTFIASVVAKNGCAVIADSLVTQSSLLMGWTEFVDYVEKKKKDDGTINLDFTELTKLFNSRPSHTKNYEEKLFKYGPYTVVTTAGSAFINSKKIGEIIEELIIVNNTNPNYEAMELQDKVISFCEFFASQAKININNTGRFGGTSFIYTYYDRDQHKTTIYKINLKSAIKRDLDNPSFKLYDYEVQPDYFRVVCDGQNRITERILFGDFETTTSLIPKVVTQVAKDHSLDIKEPDKYFEEVFKSLQSQGQLDSLAEDMKMFQMSPLSLQQAVDLACLLMRLEIDIQQYTRNIPTVGGLIKLATIDKNGINLISGENILKPDYIR